MVKWIRHAEYRANLDEYEDGAAGLECLVIKDDEEDIPRMALIPFEAFQQFARAFRPKAMNLLEMSPEDIRAIVDYEVPDEPRDGEIEYAKFKEDPEYYLNVIASFEPLLITMQRARQWAVLPYEVLEQLHRGDRQLLDELLKERPRRPSSRDETDEEAPEEPEQPNRSDEPQR